MAMTHTPIQGMIRDLRTILAARDTEHSTDAELLERYVADRDELAFATLVQRHGGMVLSVCRHRLRNLDDAEDASQAVFLILARKAGTIRRRATLASWLHGVARRVANNMALLAHRRKERQGFAVEVAQSPDNRDITWRELQVALDEEMERLPDAVRAAVVLCYLEGKTRDEAAMQLGWTLPTLRGRLERGRNILRNRMARRGLLGAAVLATLETSSAMAAAMPVAMVVSTAKAAVGFAAGQNEVAGLISAQAIALTNGAMKNMMMTKLKVAAMVLVFLGLTGLSAGVAGYRALANGKPGNEDKMAAVPETTRPPSKEAQKASDQTEPARAAPRGSESKPSGSDDKSSGSVNKPVTVGQKWTGSFPKSEDEPLMKETPAHSYIADEKTWAKLWKAWRGNEELPKVDFDKQLVIVGTVKCAKNGMNLNTKLDDNGNLEVSVFQTDIAGPGFRYQIVVVDRTGVKTVNGAEIK
jgi:RNA polymerase sigma factor (sigma-70 family)